MFVVIYAQINLLIMKKTLAFVAISATLLSCSNDDDASKEFFNLNEGNLWVYKRYYSDSEGQNFVFRGQIDSVTITGQEVINGITYSVLHHTNSFGNNSATDKYRRVDENGHLVNERGFVLHPGTDTEYTFKRTLAISDIIYGEITHVMEDQQNVTIEGNKYKIYPFVQYLESFTNVPGGNAGGYSYAKGIGLVISRDRYLSTLSYIEDRLVSYDIN